MLPSLALILLNGLCPALAVPGQQVAFAAPRLERPTERVLRLSWPARPADSLLERLASRYDVWAAATSSLDVRVAAHDQTTLESELAGTRASIWTLHADVSALVAAAAASADVGPHPLDLHEEYHNLAAIDSLLRLFQADHADLARLVEIGTSAENRTIAGLAIGRPPRAPKGKRKRPHAKRTLLVVGGQHAREWVSTAATLFMAQEVLLRAHRAPKKLRRILEAFELVFVPVLNPDGYVYSFEHDRLWRKNRQRVGNDCHGIDLNRNWGSHWLPDRFDNPCSDSNPGTRAFEAIETAALRDWIRYAEHDVVGLLDTHSFGQMLMFPYAYSCDKAPSHVEDLIEAAYGATRAAHKERGLTWEVGAVCSVSYPSVRAARPVWPAR